MYAVSKPIKKNIVEVFHIFRQLWRKPRMLLEFLIHIKNNKFSYETRELATNMTTV